MQKEEIFIKDKEAWVLTKLDLKTVLLEQEMGPILAGVQVVLSTRIDHRSIVAKATGVRQGEASIQTTKVEASIGTHSKDRERKDLQSMKDPGRQSCAMVGLLKETISIKVGKIKLYLDHGVIRGVGVG